MFLFSSRERGEHPATDEFLRLAGQFGIPTVSLSYQAFKSAQAERTPPPGAPLPAWRKQYDRQAMDMLSGFSPDICVLAGYMLIVGPEMCRRYRMINLHPAAPGGPTGTWREVIWRLIDTRARSTGAMVHLVTPELDQGPVVTYCTFPIAGAEFDPGWSEVGRRSAAEVMAAEGEGNALFRIIRQHGAARELPLIVATLKALAERRITIDNDGVRDASGERTTALDLTPRVDDVMGKVL